MNINYDLILNRLSKLSRIMNVNLYHVYFIFKVKSPFMGCANVLLM